MEDELKEYWHKRMEIIDELEKYIIEYPGALSQYAHKIGIATPTLINALQRKKPLGFRTWGKIKQFLRENN